MGKLTIPPWFGTYVPERDDPIYTDAEQDFVDAFMRTPTDEVDDHMLRALNGILTRGNNRRDKRNRGEDPFGEIPQEREKSQ